MNPRRRRSFKLPPENFVEAAGINVGWTHEDDVIHAYLRLAGWDEGAISLNALDMTAEEVRLAREFLNDFFDYLEPLCAARDVEAEREKRENEGNHEFRPDPRLYRTVPAIHRGLRTATRNREELRKRSSSAR